MLILGGEHGLNGCREPFHQTFIARNKAKFEIASLVITLVIESVLVIDRIIRAVETKANIHLGFSLLMELVWLLVENDISLDLCPFCSQHWLWWYNHLRWDQFLPSWHSPVPSLSFFGYFLQWTWNFSACFEDCNFSSRGVFGTF